MTVAGITWIAPIAGLVDGVDAYIARIERATWAAALRLQAILEEEAKRGAPWTDRTGDARRELFGASEIAGEMIVIYLSHGAGISYGVFLETLRGGKFSVVLKTIEKHMGDLFQLIAEELGS